MSAWEVVAIVGAAWSATSLAWALVCGLGVGFGASTLAGYRDDEGEAVAPGSVWFLIPWGVSASGMLWGSLANSADGLALAVLGMFASTGVGLGQLAAAAMAVRAVSRAWEDRPLPAGLDSVAELLAENRPAAPAPLPVEAAVQTCPRGHRLPTAGLHFCPTCGTAVRCPNGHLILAPAAAFCADCGSPLRELARQT